MTQVMAEPIDGPETSKGSCLIVSHPLGPGYRVHYPTEVCTSDARNGLKLTAVEETDYC
jgi:hypothetical protein